MTVEVRFGASRAPKVSAAWVRRVVGAALRSERAVGRGVSVLVTGDREIRALNRRHLRHDYATDVIAFGAAERDFLGDVVVSSETARRQAVERSLPYRQELARYLVHGTLHLMGHDDKKPGPRRRMFARQERVVAHLA